jgi:hypothetical protein
MRVYLEGLVVAVDRLLNALSGGDGRETISSRAGKRADAGNRAAVWFCRVIGLVLGHDHCHCSEEAV